jgi:TATA-binding protein-associated factor
VGHFLRRTTTSVNWEGKVLLPLPEAKEIIGLVELTEREAAIIAERAKAAKDV